MKFCFEDDLTATTNQTLLQNRSLQQKTSSSLHLESVESKSSTGLNQISKIVQQKIDRELTINRNLQKELKVLKEQLKKNKGQSKDHDKREAAKKPEVTNDFQITHQRAEKIIVDERTKNLNQISQKILKSPSIPQKQQEQEKQKKSKKTVKSENKIKNSRTVKGQIMSRGYPCTQKAIAFKTNQMPYRFSMHM